MLLSSTTPVTYLKTFSVLQNLSALSTSARSVLSSQSRLSVSNRRFRPRDYTFPVRSSIHPNHTRTLTTTLSVHNPRHPCVLFRCSSHQQQRSTHLQAVLGLALAMDEYRFNDSRLKKKMDNPERTPLLLVACGSFSPITFLHLRMFVMADDYNKHNTEYEVIGGYLSPVSDAYKKHGLAGADHR